MSLLDDILARQQADQPAPPQRGAEDYVRIDPDTGEGHVGVTVAGDRDPVWDDELRALGVDPERFEVYGDYLEIRTWDAAIGDGKTRRMRYVKARIRARDNEPAVLDDALDLARKARPPRRKTPLDLERADILALSDWQIGKAGEAGGGTEETAARVIDTIGRMQDRVERQRRAGVRAGTLVLPGMGDVIERCDGHYPSQTYRVDLNERDQRKVAATLLTRVVRDLAPYYDRIVTGAVASNHGENRKGGKAFTDESDSADLELWDHLATVVAEAGDKLAHVEVIEPRDPLVLAIEAAGTPVAWTHGHKATKGASASDKLWQWWNGQRAYDQPTSVGGGRVIGELPAGRARVLIAAHYHHHYAREEGGRLLVGCPALDGGSRWLTDSVGVWSEPGSLVMRLDGDHWRPRDIDIL